MKKLLHLLMPLVAIVAMALPWNASAQDTVTIGTGTTTSSSVPFSSLWGYSFVEQVYPDTAINMAGQITVVQFYLGTSATAVQTNNITLYMKNVTRSTFSSTSDYEPVTANDIVYSGPWTIPANYTGWVEIELDTPFDYDGSSNLLVAMHEYTSGYSTRYFRYTSANNASVRFYSDSYNPDPYNLSSYSGSSSLPGQLANMKIAITTGDIACHRVKNLSASNIAPWSCTLNWIDTNNTGATYTVLSLPDSSVVFSSVNDTSVNITGLNPDTTYNFCVYADCGGDGLSRASNISVHTLVSCPPPTHLTVDTITSTGATVSWTPGYEETEWVLAIGDSVFFSPSDTTFELTELESNTIYNITLRAVCGVDDSSAAVSLSFRTMAGEPISEFPYTCGFEINEDGENEAVNWVLENNTPNGWYVGTAAHNSGTKGLYISNDNGTSNNYTNTTSCVSYAYASFQMEPGEYSFSFDWKSGGESSWDFLRAAIAPLGTATPNDGWTSSSVAPGFTPVDGGYMNLQSSAWQTKQGTFTITTAGVYNFYFVWRNDGSSGSNPGAAVDNITISLNTCPAPVAMRVDTLDYSTITVSWHPIGEETEWAITIGDSLITGVSDTTYVITGLEQYTQYTMKVRAVCSEGDTSFYSPSATARTTVSCPWPTNLTATYVSEDSITVTWRSNGTENTWLLTLNNGTPVVANDTTYTFESLSPNTLYNISVRALCSDEDTSFAVSTNVRTECGLLADLPYTTSFENDPTGSSTFAYCWTRINDATGTYNYFPYIYTNATYAHTGNNGMYWYLANTTGYANNEYAVLPELDTVAHPVNTLELMFWAKTTATSAPFPKFIVGVMTDNTNDSTFTPYDTITLTSTWTEYTVDFSEYDGYGAFIAIRCPRTTTSRYAALDDVMLRVPNPCSMPSNFVANATVADSVVLTWSENGTATSWEVAYGLPGYNPDTISTVVVSTDSSYVFSNLLGGVNYEMYVRANCGSGYSYWTGPLSVTPGTYVMGASGSATISMCSGVIYDDGGPSGNYSNNANYTLTIYPASADSMLTFHGTGYLESSSWEHLTIYEGVGTNGNILWEHTNATGAITIPLDTCASGPITINFSSDGSSTYAGFEIFINCVGAPDCSPVEALTVQPTPTAALVTWQPGFFGVYSGATVEYKADSVDDAWTSLPMTTGNYAVITGLEPNTDYNVRVLTDCDGYQGGEAMANFTTKEFGCILDPASAIDVTIGTGSTTNNYIPSYSLYNYSYTQQFFKASEIGGSGMINKITLTPSAVTSQRTYEIYMGQSPDTAASSFITPAGLTCVYNGGHIPLEAGQPVTFELTTPFNYSDTANLVVIFRDLTGSWTSGTNWYGDAAWTNASCYVYSDGSAYNVPQTSGGTASSFRNKITFYGGTCIGIHTCAAPAAAVVDVTTTTATLVWAPGNTETSWNIYYRLSGDTAWSAPVAVTGSTYTITGLASGMPYEFMVENACDEGNFAAIAEGTTLCAAITLPFSENFNGWGTGVLPNCWYNTGSYSGYAVISNGQNMTGTTGGSVYMYSDDDVISHIILPELDSTYQLNQTQLVFFAKYTSTSYSAPAFRVGVMTDPQDVTTFVPVDTVSIQGGINQWEVVEVPMSSYTGTGAYVAIQTLYQDDYFFCYIDNVSLELIPTCPRPDSLSATNATSTTVELAWHERGGATSWVVEYGPVGFALGTGTTVVATSNPFTLTGLTPNTMGEFYVRSVCSATDTGDYSYTGCTFSTTQVPATLPYNYDFEDAAEWANWQTNSNHTTNNWYRGTSVADSGSYSMYVATADTASYYGYSFNAIVNAAAYRDIDFGAVDSSFTLSFRARAGGTTTNYFDGLMVFLVDPSIPAVASTAGITSPWGNVNDLYRIATMRLDTTWQTYEASFDTIHGVQRVAFFWFNQNTTATNIPQPAAVDNIHIDYASCPRPVALEAVPTTNSAMLTWTGEAGANYEITYRMVGDTVNDVVYSSTNSFNLTGLTSPAQYIFWVRKVCGDGDTSLYSDSKRFTTPCTSITTFPWVEDFENTANFDCWAQDGENEWLLGTGDYSTSTGSHSGTHNALIKSSSNSGDVTKLISPILALDTASPAELSFWYVMRKWVNDLDELRVYYRTSQTDTWHLLKEITAETSAWTKDSIMLPNLSSTYQIAFEHTEKYGYGIGIDDISVSGAAGSACVDPVIVNSSVAETQVTISFVGEAALYEVAYVQGGNWSVPTTTFTTADTFYTFTGLTEATQYTFGVRAVCSEADFSEWSTVTLTTAAHPCYMPTNLHVVSTAIDGGSIAWEAGENETEWEVNVTSNTVAIDSTITVTNTPALTLTGLEAGTSYNVMVRSVCGANNYSDWTDAVTLTTRECDQVTGVNVTEVTATSAKVSWTATGATKYLVEYGGANYSAGAGTQIVVENATNVTLNNLEPDSYYDVYVSQYCSATVTSPWSTKVSFQTPQGQGIDGVEGSQVRLYPNPASTTVAVSGIEGEAMVSVVDVNGREVYKTTANGDITIDLTGYAKGAYFVRITGERTMAIRKLVVR